MRRIFTVRLFFLFLMSVSPLAHGGTLAISNYENIDISSSKITSIERKARVAAVKIVGPLGSGSGSLMSHKGIQFVITAQHVVADDAGGIYIIQKGSESHIGVIVYADASNDIAILFLKKEFKSIAPMKYYPTKKIPDPGDLITYSGYPSDHELLTYRGRVAGYENLKGSGKQILLHTFGWYGCSGSAIFNSYGKIVGILWGIDVEKGLPIESLIWVSPIQNLDIDVVISNICNVTIKKYRACG